ncbi:MAG TPA: hypothetical protein ENJ35_09140 [Gammaproteobacteria bacterium]|nr:hypothetical protein [Gammaproteobacteria bacterium]
MHTYNFDPTPITPIDDEQAIAASHDLNAGETSGNAKLTGFLRWAGVILILFSALGFMLQGYAQVEAGLRYWIGLFLTMALAGGGVLCAHALHETVGARIFFGLATLFVIVQSTQVGAMLYGWLQPDHGPTADYEWLKFYGVSQAMILLDMVITAVVMLLVGYAGFSILARSRSKTLIAAFLLGNVSILFPSRHELVISLMLIGLFIYLRRIETRMRMDFAMQSWEGRAARAIIFTPLMILAGRESLYPANGISLATVLALLAFVSIWDLGHYTRRGWIRACGELLGILLATGSWAVVFIALHPSVFNFHLFSPTFPITLSLLWLMLSLKAGHGAILRTLAALMALATVSLNDTSSTSTLLLGVIFTGVGIQFREKMTLLPGIVCIVLGSIGYIKGMIGLYAQAPWISSAVLGFTVIFLASWIEKNPRRVFSRAVGYLNEVRSW